MKTQKKLWIKEPLIHSNRGETFAQLNKSNLKKLRQWLHLPTPYLGKIKIFAIKYIQTRAVQRPKQSWMIAAPPHHSNTYQYQKFPKQGATLQGSYGGGSFRLIKPKTIESYTQKKEHHIHFSQAPHLGGVEIRFHSPQSSSRSHGETSQKFSYFCGNTRLATHVGRVVMTHCSSQSDPA